MTGSQINGRFRLETRLYPHATGEVFRAVDLATGGAAAVKILKPRITAGAGFGARLRQEFQLMRQLKHPAIVAAIDAGATPEGAHFLATELVEGRTLQEALAIDGPLSAARVVRLALPIAQALQAAHQLGVIHRDLNPGNILITRDAAGVEAVKLLDFGLAKAIDREAVSAAAPEKGGFSGTFFIAPEQALGRPVTPLTDVYLLAATMYYSLAGAPPFSKETEADLAKAHATEDAPPLRTHNPAHRTPPAAERILMMALSRDPKLRPASATEFVKRFESALHTSPTVESNGKPSGPSRRTAIDSGVRLLADRYRLEERISQSANGEIYKGSDLFTGKPIAVKMMVSRLIAGEQFGARLRREFELLKQLTHPQIVRVLDAGQASDKEHFLVMEYLEGETLAQRVKHCGPLSASQAVSLVLDVAAALDSAHAQNILHRDVNPGNIMLQVGRTGKIAAKLFDFGLAKLTGGENERNNNLNATGANVILGNCEYMSPEQAKGQAATRSSDIYSLASTLYFALCGRAPFAADSYIKLLVAKSSSRAPRFADVAPNVAVPAAIERVILEALGRAPESRPDSAGEFAAQLVAASE
ncbi:MAG TPA: serine/threonine-protein kinase, partial [Planctomycetia bacterium]|nr:serine/threonine-protein kinase [Planctomycetia bacterium]